MQILVLDVIYLQESIHIAYWGCFTAVWAALLPKCFLEKDKLFLVRSIMLEIYFQTKRQHTQSCAILSVASFLTARSYLKRWKKVRGVSCTTTITINTTNINEDCRTIDPSKLEYWTRSKYENKICNWRLFVNRLLYRSEPEDSNTILKPEASYMIYFFSTFKETWPVTVEKATQTKAFSLLCASQNISSSAVKCFWKFNLEHIPLTFFRTYLKRTLY